MYRLKLTGRTRLASAARGVVMARVAQNAGNDVTAPAETTAPGHSLPRPPEERPP